MYCYVAVVNVSFKFKWHVNMKPNHWRPRTPAPAWCGVESLQAGALLGVPQSLTGHNKVLEAHARMSAEPNTAELLTRWHSSAASHGGEPDGSGPAAAADGAVGGVWRSNIVATPTESVANAVPDVGDGVEGRVPPAAQQPCKAELPSDGLGLIFRSICDDGGDGGGGSAGDAGAAVTPAPSTCDRTPKTHPSLDDGGESHGAAATNTNTTPHRSHGSSPTATGSTAKKTQIPADKPKAKVAETAVKKNNKNNFLAEYNAYAPVRFAPTHGFSHVGAVRMAWGNTQEATSVLAALNYFGGLGCEVSEAGMLPFEALSAESVEATYAKWPALTLIGASPDAMLKWPVNVHSSPTACVVSLCSRARGGWGWPRPLPSASASASHTTSQCCVALAPCQGHADVPRNDDARARRPDGTVEPFEVKNHAPFAHTISRGGGRSRKGAPKFAFRDPGANSGIAVWHLPQLYLHMLCAGPGCRSCTFMSCSATRGANIFRIHRNDELMALMLHFLNLFCVRHVRGQQRPPANLFWGEKNHRALLEKTIQAARRVEKVATIKPEDVQRGPEEPFWLK